MLRKYLCAALMLMLGIVAQSRASHAIAVDPLRNSDAGHVRMPLPTHRIGPELILFSQVAADLFPDCEADDAELVPVIIYIFLPSSEEESAVIVAEVACVKKELPVSSHPASFSPQW
jgi:hypothetical protein